MASSFSKVLIISGPTSIGKTSLAQKLAKDINGELISADSRQIYQGMDIGTGKDLKKNQIWLVDLISPSQRFDVYQWLKLCHKKIADIHLRGKLPIVVGGTGLYVHLLVNNRLEFTCHQSKTIRYIAKYLSTSLISNVYHFLDNRAFSLLSKAERSNRHRLIRRIEKTIFASHSKPTTQQDNYNFLHISLTASNNTIYQRIDNRVKKRIKQGLLAEIQSLVSRYSWQAPGLRTIAYQEFKPYFINKNQTSSLLLSCQERWKHHEHAYARRQKTWFKKHSSFLFDISSPEYPDNVTSRILRWYNKA